MTPTGMSLHRAVAVFCGYGIPRAGTPRMIPNRYLPGETSTIDPEGRKLHDNNRTYQKFSTLSAGY
jgi:hypothetical protein